MNRMQYNLYSPPSCASTLLFQSMLVMFAITSVLRNGNVMASDILVTNNPQCTEIGKRLMQRNASVEQIYVAVSLCEGIVHPMDSGIGGGFQAIFYDYSGNHSIAKYLLSREYSPYASAFTKRPLLFGNSVGVPSVLAGYARLLGINDCLVTPPNTPAARSRPNEKYYSQDCIERIKNGIKSGMNINGSPASGVPYHDIFRDCIHLARFGFRVSPTFAAIYSYLPLVSQLIPYNVVTGTAINLPLANFLEFLSGDPLRLLDPYVEWANRKIAKNENIRRVMLEDVRYFYSNLTSRDFLSYEAKLLPPLTISFRYRNVTYKLLTMQSPAGGEPIAFFAKMIETINKITRRRGIRALLSNEKISVLFVLCSKSAYSSKPYFRQLNPATKRNLIVTQAPKIARSLYRKVLRANHQELFRLVNDRSMNTVFGAIHLPEIRVKRRRGRTDFSSPIDSEDLAHNSHEADDNDYFDFSDDDNNERKNEREEEEDDEVLSEDEGTQSETVSTLSPSLYDISEEALFNHFTNAMTSANMSQFYSMIDNDQDDDDTPLGEREFEGGADDNPYGTTNVVIKKGRRAIVATSSINHSYGSGIASTRLGIFYNNVLRDFTPNSYYQRMRFKNGTKKFFRFPNRIRPHSIPSSSMGCTLLVNPATGNPVFGIGGAGGFKITGAIFNVLWNYFVQGLPLNESVDRLRLITKVNYKHNKTEIWYELPPHIDSSVVMSPEKSSLNQIALNLSNSDRPHSLAFFHRYRSDLNVFFIKEAGYSAVTAFTTLRGVVMGSYDNRRGGQAYVRL